MIKRCKGCGKKFETKRKNRVFCYVCRPPQHRRPYPHNPDNRIKASVLMLSKVELQGWADAIRKVAVFRSPGLVETWRQFADDMESCPGFGPELEEIADRFVRLTQNGFTSDELVNMARIFCVQIKNPIEIKDTRTFTKIERFLDEKFG